MLAIEASLYSDPLAYTVFNPAQERCIAAFARDPKMIIVPMPNGIGKTFVLVAIMGAIMWPTANPLFAHPVYQRWPYRKQLRFSSTAKSVEDGEAFQVAIAELWPRQRYEMSRGAGKSYYSAIESDTGYHVDVLTYNQTPLEHASGTKGAVFCSEPPPKPVFTEDISRVRGQGPLYLEMTPITYAAYIKREYIDPGALIGEDGREVGRIEVVTGDIEENCSDHHVGGVLSHVAIEQMVAAWPIEERALRRTGQFGVQAGLIYQCWGAHNEWDELPDYHAECWDRGRVNVAHVLDPHDRKPWAHAWIFTFPNDDVVVMTEYPNYVFHQTLSAKESVDDHRFMVLSTEADLETEVDRPRLIDPRFGNAPKLGGASAKELFSKSCRKCEAERKRCDHRLTFSDPPDAGAGSVRVGHTMVRDAIGNPAEGLRPKLYALKPYVPNFCYAMRNYGFRETKNMDKTGPVEDPELVHKDFPDLIRYFFLARYNKFKEPPRPVKMGRKFFRKRKS